MIDSFDLYRRFEKFVGDLFEDYHFTVVREPSSVFGNGRHQADLIVTSTTGAKAVVEVRLFRARHISTGALRNVAAQVEAFRHVFDCSKAVIVTTARIDPLAKAELRVFPDLVVYDYDRLAWLSTVNSARASEFAAIVRDARVFGSGDEDIPKAFDGGQVGPIELQTLPADLQLKSDPVQVTVAEANIPARGIELCKELDAIKPKKSKDKAHARAFEKKCIECLKYLFAEDLQFGGGQHTTKSGLSRFDLIARIRSKSEFWNLLVADFGCRYVVFEFKCFSEKITQGQILTTEKYLFVPALRSTAIIISTNGPDDNAYATACGALREHGKLIINLTVEQVCKMLKAKDGLAIGGPSDVENELFVTLDEMLMGIER